MRLLALLDLLAKLSAGVTCGGSLLKSLLALLIGKLRECHSYLQIVGLYLIQ